MHYVFSQHVLEKKIFFNTWPFLFFCLFGPANETPGGGMVIKIIIFIPLVLEMVQTKNGYVWPCCFQEEFKHVKLLTMTVEAQLQLSDSDDLKCNTYFEL